MGSSTDCCVGMGKFLAFLAFVTFLLHAAGLANPYWLEKKITVPVPVPGAVVEVESNIGVLWACNDQKNTILNVDKYKCESLADVDADLVADWQWVAAGLGVAALVGSFVALILSCCIACVAGRNMGIRAAAIFCYFLSCAMAVAVLVLFNENKEVTAMGMTMEYNFNWGYYVAAAGACMFFVMSLLHMFALCGTKKVNTIV